MTDILFDGLYISSGGGMVMMCHLIDLMEKRFPGRIHYLIDARVGDKFPHLPDDRKTVLTGSLSTRWKYYRKHRNDFSVIICHGNIPPPVKCRGKVFIFVANIYYCEIPKEFSFKFKFLLYMKQLFVRLTKGNADIWVMQSSFMKELWSKKFGIPQDKHWVYPIIDFHTLQIPVPALPRREDGDYLYVTDYTPGKRIEMLIEAWKILAGKGFHKALHLTCSRNAEKLRQLIEDAERAGARIVNHGFMPHSQLDGLFRSCRATVYNSANESLGLGLVEAIAFGCDVIAPDLPYVHSVCVPSLVFEDGSIGAIVDAVLRYERGEGGEAKALLKDETLPLLEAFAEVF